MEEKERFRLAIEILNLWRERGDPYERDLHSDECKGHVWTLDNPPDSACLACLAEWELENDFTDKLGDAALLGVARKYVDIHEQVTELHYPITSLSEEDQDRVFIVHQEKKRRKGQIKYQARIKGPMRLAS